MKKIILLIVCAICMLTGCSKTDTEDMEIRDLVELHGDKFEKIELEDDFNITFNLFIPHKQYGLYGDSTKLELDLYYDNQIMHMPLFNGRPSIELNDGSIIEYQENSESKDSPNAWYNDSFMPNKDEWITIHLYKNENLLEGYATYISGIVYKEFWTFYYQLDNENISNLSVQLTGEKITVADVSHYIDSLSFLMVTKNQFVPSAILFVSFLVLAIIGYHLLANKVYIDGVEKKVSIILVMFCLSIGGIGLLGKFLPAVGCRVLNTMNAALSSSCPYLTFETGLISGFWPYVFIVLSIIGLLCISDEFLSVSDVVLIFIGGLLCVPFLYLLFVDVFNIFVEGIGAIGEVLFIVVCGGMLAFAGESGDVVTTKFEEKKEEVKKHVEVWEEDDAGRILTRYPVNSDGTHYKKDGEWIKIPNK